MNELAHLKVIFGVFSKSWLNTSLGFAANVYLPKDRVTNQHMGYGFVEFRSEEDADYVRPIIHLGG